MTIKQIELRSSTRPSTKDGCNHVRRGSRPGKRKLWWFGRVTRAGHTVSFRSAKIGGLRHGIPEFKMESGILIGVWANGTPKGTEFAGRQRRADIKRRKLRADFDVVGYRWRNRLARAADSRPRVGVAVHQDGVSPGPTGQEGDDVSDEDGQPPITAKGQLSSSVARLGRIAWYCTRARSPAPVRDQRSDAWAPNPPHGADLPADTGHRPRMRRVARAFSVNTEAFVGTDGRVSAAGTRSDHAGWQVCQGWWLRLRARSRPGVAGDGFPVGPNGRAC